MNYNFEIIELKKKDIDTKRLKRLVNHICSKEDVDSDLKLNIILADNERLQELNKKFKGLDRPTDVLSFYFDGDKVKVEPLLGEVYISIDKADQQCQKYNVSLQNEVERLMVHGILHLLGCKHQTEKDAKKMFSKTESYLSYHEMNGK